eukprot:IDg2379t1
MALAMIAQAVCTDPARVSLREIEGGLLDRRRWNGRSERAVGRQWATLKSECQKFEEAMVLVSKGDSSPDEHVGSLNKFVDCARPIGSKLAKAQKKRKHDPDDKLNDHMASMVSAMHEQNISREKREVRKLALKEQKLAFQKFSVLFSASSGASEEYRTAIQIRSERLS